MPALHLTEPSRSVGPARSAGDAAAPALWRGLVGVWAPSMGRQGERLLDWGPLGNHLGPVGGIYPFPDWAHSSRGQVLSFNGSNRKAYQSAARGLPGLSQPMTLAVWLLTNTAVGLHSALTINDNAGAAGNLLTLRISTGVPQAATVGGTILATTGVTLSTGVWAHVAYTFDGVTNRIYFNGVEMQNTATGHTAAPLSLVWLGDNGADSLWNGHLDMALVYSRPLASSEVQTLAMETASPLTVRHPGKRLGRMAIAPDVAAALYRFFFAT